ncbi:XRE family transcriptional regulator [Rhodococcus erythropolis]
MTAIGEQSDRFGWSQVVAGQNLDVTRPRLSDLYCGTLIKFSLDALCRSW